MTEGVVDVAGGRVKGERHRASGRTWVSPMQVHQRAPCVGARLLHPRRGVGFGPAIDSGRLRRKP